jgi:hypothetical protein
MRSTLQTFAISVLFAFTITTSASASDQISAKNLLSMCQEGRKHRFQADMLGVRSHTIAVYSKQDGFCTGYLGAFSDQACGDHPMSVIYPAFAAFLKQYPAYEDKPAILVLQQIIRCDKP